MSPHPVYVRRDQQGFHAGPGGALAADLRGLVVLLGEAALGGDEPPGLCGREREKLRDWVGTLALARTRRVGWSVEDELRAALLVESCPQAAREFEAHGCSRSLRQVVLEEGLEGLLGRAVCEGAVYYIPPSLLEKERESQREDEQHAGAGEQDQYLRRLHRLYGSALPAGTMMSWVYLAPGRLASPSQVVAALVAERPDLREMVANEFPDLLHLVEPEQCAHGAWERMRGRA